MTRLGGCKIITLPRISDPRGNLTFVEQTRHIPFDIKRVYYLYDVPGGESRGGHAHRALEQFIVAAAGSFEVSITDGQERETVTLNKPFEGLYVPRMVWRDIQNFSSGAVCLVLASDYYDENDYVRDFEIFRSTTDS